MAVEKRPLSNHSAEAQPRQPIKPRLLNISEASTYLGRSSGALRMMIHRGQVPVVRLSGRVQLDIEDLDRLISANKVRETVF